MKYIAYAWGKGNDGVLFFVQRLEEMLFHYSDDIVKTPIHNTATLIEEYIILERDKNVKSFHLNMISDELIRSLQNDIIAKNRIGSKRIEGIINEIRINPNDTIHYLHGLITTSDYMKWCSNYLIEKLNKENAKEEITKGLRGWISAIIQSGYSPEYIYRYLKNEFDKEEIADPYNVCIDFLQHFNKENNEYRVYFRFYAIMKSYQSLLIERLEVSFDDDNWFDQLNNKKNKSFVGYVDIKAIDPYVAMEQAFNALNIFIKFYRVISNHKKAIVSNSGMVRRISDDVCMYLPVKSRGYKAIEVEPKMDLKSMIDSVVLGCQRKGANTYSHVNKAINLHNMALSQLDLNDGFVNLWSILEVVSSDSKEESKIKSVVDSVLPILQNDFFFKYFISLCDDIKTALNRTDYQNLLKCILHGDSPQYKIACLIFLEEYEDLREELFELLELYPNIRNRIFKLYKLRKDKKEVFKIASMYGERVKWHLYRLYRVRNDIVHAGKSTKNIALLGEHLHIYCDSIIDEILVKLAYRDGIHTIKDVFVDTKLLLIAKAKAFDENMPMKEDDIRIILMKYFDEVNDSCYGNMNS